MVKALIIIACMLAFFVLLLFLPVTLVIKYNTQLKIYARVLFIKIPISPPRKKRVRLSYYSSKKVRARREKALKKQNRKKAAASEVKEEKKHSLSDIYDLICDIISALEAFFDRFSNHLKIKLVDIDITVCGEDCAKTALILGGVNEGIRTLVTLLEDHTDFDMQRDVSRIRTRADFIHEKSTANVELRFGINLFGVIRSLLATLPFVKKILDKI